MPIGNMCIDVGALCSWYNNNNNIDYILIGRDSRSYIDKCSYICYAQSPCAASDVFASKQ